MRTLICYFTGTGNSLATLGRSRYDHPEVNLLDILSRFQLAQVELGIEREGSADV